MKPRRDITLGEMQDECKFRGCDCSTLGGGMCDYFDVCESMHNKKDNFQSPCDWDLTDPPRFNEAQMAFFKWWYDRGARTAMNKNTYEHGAITVFEDANGSQIGNAQIFLITGAVKDNGKPLNLAELFGKEGAIDQ